MRYSLSKIAELCGGRLAGPDREVTEVATDSRSCAFGGEPMFAAIAGANHDGHRYIGQMYGRGVRAFLCEREVPEMAQYADAGFVVAGSTVAALQRLAAHRREEFGGVVVGITGSNGKTVLKEWIAQTLPDGVKLFRSPKSYNSQLGVALSLLMMEGDEDVALIEAGISRPDEMSRLERMIRPDIAILTSMGDAHQENFITVEEKTIEKLQLARRAGTLIFHSAYDYVEELAAKYCPDCRRVDAAEYAVTGIEDELTRRNAQIVKAFCDVAGSPSDDVAGSRPVVAMRSEVKEGINDSVIIDDTYNSDINSLALALDYLHSMASGRGTTLILSDILQSGMSGDELYSRAARLAERAEVGLVIGIGRKIAEYAEKFTCDKRFYATADDFLKDMRRDDIAGRAVLLKGNRSSRFERVSHALEKKSHTTTLTVDLDAMVHNLNWFRARLRPQTRLTAMVKASSYGAGDFEVAQMLQHQGVDFLAVAFADEGVRLCERGITMRIVVLNADEGSFEAMIANRLEPEIYSLHSLAEFVAAAERFGEMNYPIHIKLDTGMHRLGFTADELDAAIGALKGAARRVRVASAFAHLCVADDASQDEFTRLQISRFDEMSARLRDALGYDIIRHTANSAAIERFPEAQFDMCRLGIGLYGFGGSDELRPVATLRTRIVQLKRLAAGETVGYGRAGQLVRDSVTATIPIGYADGLDRHLGCGRWSMLVGGQAAPIVGRVCMDSCMIDVTDIPDVREGDEVTVFSASAGNTAADMAAVLDTIPYEVLTSVSVRVKRIYTKE